MNHKEYFFDDVKELIAYLYEKFDTIPPLKLQKGLYFLFAYYAAMYGNKNKTEEFEINYDFPSYLFPAKFEAWGSGSVIRSVYEECKNNETIFQQITQNFNYQKFKDKNQEIQLFIDGLFSQILESSDFALVERNQQDISWQNAFNQGQKTIISNESIKHEYIAKLMKLSI